MTQEERLKIIIDHYCSTNSEFAVKVGVGRNAVHNWLTRGFGSSVIDKIVEAFPDLDASWIAFGEGSMLKSDKKNEATYIENKNGNSFMQLPNGQYLMSMPKIPYKTQAGFLDNYKDVSYLEETDQHSMIVKEVHRGRYVAFEVEGHSMFDGSFNSIQQGSIVATRELGMEHWRDKLNYKKFPFWVIYCTESSTPLLKQIIDHDTENCTIVCHSLNDSIEYGDFELSMNEINALFYVVNISKPIGGEE